MESFEASKMRPSPPIKQCPRMCVKRVPAARNLRGWTPARRGPVRAFNDVRALPVCVALMSSVSSILGHMPNKGTFFSGGAAASNS